LIVPIAIMLSLKQACYNRLQALQCARYKETPITRPLMASCTITRAYADTTWQVFLHKKPSNPCFRSLPRTRTAILCRCHGRVTLKSCTMASLFEWKRSSLKQLLFLSKFRFVSTRIYSFVLFLELLCYFFLQNRRIILNVIKFI
jgi:hypothetical protein